MHKWRNAILGTLLVLTGLGTTAITVLAHRFGEPQLASVSAIASLVIVGLILILVVPPLARSAGAEVKQLDFPVQLTPGGLIFLGILGIVAFAAWNTNNNLLFLVFSLLTSTLFVALVAAGSGLRELVVSARFPDHIFAGEPAPVIVTLRNTKRFLPSFSILIEARGPAGEEAEKEKKRRPIRRLRFNKRSLAYFIYVPHRASAEQRVEQLFEKRGHILVTGFELSTRFPFGFFRRRRRLRARDVDLIVFPKPEPVGDELHLLPMNAGRHASVRRGAGHDLLALRDYHPQDDLRHIDWKATARGQRLIVREFTAEDERRVTIALDTRVSSVAAVDKDAEQKQFAERFEEGVTLAASLVAHFIEERAEVRLVLGQEGGRYAVGQNHLYDCLRRLALVMPREQQANGDAPREAFSWDDMDIHLTADANYAIILTTAAPGSIPAHVWRASHVIYL
ncbi:MAG: DUF58 domain-containing protein [Pyrinomonadaceae bacterium]|nr:DUF58 domain-containing protein [Pyrinomonadaceae bacterium]